MQPTSCGRQCFELAERDQTLPAPSCAHTAFASSANTAALLHTRARFIDGPIAHAAFHTFWLHSVVDAVRVAAFELGAFRSVINALWIAAIELGALLGAHGDTLRLTSLQGGHHGQYGSALELPRRSAREAIIGPHTAMAHVVPDVFLSQKFGRGARPPKPT